LILLGRHVRLAQGGSDTVLKPLPACLFWIPGGGIRRLPVRRQQCNEERAFVVDYQLEHLINGPAGSHPLWDGLMTLSAQLAEPAFIGLVAIWFLIGWFGNRRLDRLGALGALGAAAGALAVNLVVSHLWYRPRPFVEHPSTVHLLVKHSSDASFPSDHAAAAFAIAVVLLVVHRRLGALAVLAAALVAYARVYAGEHYPGDVLAGAAIGLVTALVVPRVLRGLVDFVDSGMWQAGGALRLRPPFVLVVSARLGDAVRRGRRLSGGGGRIDRS
jgi:undecaprenyl-diphosphatase